MKHIHVSRQVKEKALAELLFHEFDGDSPPRGFKTRDLVRFLAVDIIVLFSIKLLLGLGLFPDVDWYVAAILASKLVLAAYLIWIIRDFRQAWPETGAVSGGRLWGWLAAFAVYGLAYPFLLHFQKYNHLLLEKLYLLFGSTYIPEPQDVMVLVFEDILSLPLRIVLVTFVALFGPLLEELAFRGVGVDAYSRTGGTIFTLATTSLLFGLYHFSIQLFLPLSLIGLLFGIARYLSKTLWCPILLHCFHNLLSLATTAQALGLIDFLPFWGVTAE